MSKFAMLVGQIASFALLSVTACGSGEQAKTVTNSDTTTTDSTGRTQKTTTDTQVLSKDGTKDTTHTEEVKQQPAK